jgi:hypothetical protein
MRASRRGTVLDAELTASLHQGALAPTQRCSSGRRASQDDGLEVGLHHAMHAQLLCDAVQFIDVESLGTSASSATSRPTWFLNRKQSATVRARL